MTIRDRAFAALASLHPAPVFLDAYRLQQLPENLDIYVGCPEEFFLAPESLAAYDEGRLVPLLDDGNFGKVTFLDTAGGLVQKLIEQPNEPVARFTNWQQYLARLMIDVAESTDDDERVRRIADLVGFRHFDELIRFLDPPPQSPPQDYYDRRTRFISSIQG